MSVSLVGQVRRWPLVGREEELRLALEFLSRRDSGGIILAGAAGVGKTRLAAELADALRRRGWVTREVTATRGASEIPFGPFAPLLTPRERPTDQLEFLYRVEQDLLDGAGSKRLALVVDDAQLLDPASAGLVHQLASSRTVAVLATLRSGVPAPDAVTALWKDELATRIDLQPLAAAEVQKLLRHVLGGHIEGQTMRELVRASNGNVLFLRELIRAGLASKAIVQEGGVWHRSGPLKLQGGLLDLIQEGLRALDSTQRTLATVLALGEPLELAILQRIGSETDLRTIEAAGLVLDVQQGRRAFARMGHPLYGDALRQSASAFHLRTLSTQLADAIESCGAKRAEDSLRIVVLRLAAGEVPTLKVAMQTAVMALDLGDDELAERIARVAHEGGGGFGATMLLARALTYLRREAEADQLLASVSPVGDAQISSLARWRAWNLAYGLGRSQEAEQVLADSERQISDLSLRDDAVATRAMLLMSNLHFPEAVTLASEVIHRASARPALNDAYAAAIHALWAQGRTESAQKLARDGLSVLSQPDQSFGLTDNTLQYGRFRALLFAGFLGEAGELATATYRHAVESRWARARPYWAYCIGLHAFWTGRVRTAIDWEREATLRPMYTDPAFIRLSGTATIALAAVLAAEPSVAASALGVLESLREGYRVNHAWVRRAQAWGILAAGNVGSALAMLQQAAGDCRAGGYVAMEAVLLHDIARFGSPNEVAPRLQEIAEFGEGRLFAAFADHATALTAEDGDLLEECGRAFEGIGMALEAAEAFAVAARKHGDAGRGGMAAQCRQRAHTLLERCEGARSPALIGMDVSESLSKRELEIGTLAAKGMTSRDIASRLNLSGRTVDNHLQHVFEKLEVHSRLELSTALGISSRAGPTTG